MGTSIASRLSHGLAWLLFLLPASTSTLTATATTTTSDDDGDGGDAIRAILEAAVANRTFPGAVALVGTGRGGLLYQTAVGSFTYGDDPAVRARPMEVSSTIFDIASLTKVLAT